MVANEIATIFRNLNCEDEVMPIDGETVQGLNDSLENSWFYTDVFDDAHSSWPDEEKKNTTFWTMYGVKDLQMCSSLMTALTQSQESCLKLWSTKISKQVTKINHFLMKLAIRKYYWLQGTCKYLRRWLHGENNRHKWLENY